MTGKPEFHDDYLSPKLDPLAPPQTANAYDEIERSGFDPAAESYASILEAVHDLFEFLVSGNPNRPAYTRKIGWRTIRIFKKSRKSDQLIIELPIETRDEPALDDFVPLVKALEDLFRFFLAGDPRREGYPSQVGKRVIASVWATSPDYFGGSSLNRLTRLRGVEGCRAALSAHATAYYDRFGIKNRFMHSKASRKTFKMARIRHVKRMRRKRRET